MSMIARAAGAVTFMRWLAAATLALAAAAPAAASDKERRAYDFTVSWSVFPNTTLARGQLRFEEDDAFYVIALDASAKLTVPPVNWRGSFATQGDLAGTARAPQRFERKSIRPDLRESVVVSWPNGAASEPETRVERTPADRKVRREPVDPADIVNVVDPLTFAAQIFDAVRRSNGRSCEVREKTWDGARLSELSVTTESSVFGTRADCRLNYRSISGLRVDNPWRTKENTVTRIIRFEKKLGKWNPVSITIRGTFVGFQSEFVTTLTPRSAS